jgi:hypothetical protein
VDVIYTVLNRLGVVPLAVFALLAPLFLSVDGWLRFHDIIPRQLEDWLPALDYHPLASFLIYLVILDFAEYWRHRLSHTFRWWWALHGIHHSQRQMSFWTDSRNHLLDDLIAGVWFASLSLLIGVPPGQFIGLLIVLRLVENLSHANTRLGFGPLGDYLSSAPLSPLAPRPRPAGRAAFCLRLQFRDPAARLGHPVRHALPRAATAPDRHPRNHRPGNQRPRRLLGPAEARPRAALAGAWHPGRQAAFSVTRTPRRPGRAPGAPSASPSPGHPGGAGGR